MAVADELRGQQQGQGSTSYGGSTAARGGSKARPAMPQEEVRRGSALVVVGLAQRIFPLKA